MSDSPQGNVYATLKSLGTGSAPKDFVWPLYEKDATLGAGPANDIVVPSNRVANFLCTFVFKDGSYYIDARIPNKVVVRGQKLQPGKPKRVEHGEIIKMGLDQLRIQYASVSDAQKNLMTEKDKKQQKKDIEESSNPIAARLMLTLGYIQELQSTLDIQELMTGSLDAVLKVTGLDRAYAFLLEPTESGELDLKEMGARKPGGEDLVEEDYTISQTMLMKVIEGNGAVVVEDADEVSADNTNSMRDFKIKTVVCLPLTYFDETTNEANLLGVIYADKLFSKTKLPSHCRSTLQLMSQLISKSINSIRHFQEVQSMAATYENYLKELANQLDAVSDNLAVINEKVNEAPSLEEAREYSVHLAAQTESLTEIVTNIRENI